MFDKERMSCQQAFEQFATQKSPGWRERTVPLEIAVKEEENAEAENREIAAEVGDLQVGVTRRRFASFSNRLRAKLGVRGVLQCNSAVSVSHGVLLQEELGGFPPVQSSIVLCWLGDQPYHLQKRK